jgi:hypothetical protein
MRRLLYATCFALMATASAQAQDEPQLQIIVNEKIRTQTTVNDQEVQMAGRLSVHLRATERELAQDFVNIGGLNLAYLGVPMEPFTGIPPGRLSDDGTGVLGVTLDLREKQVLRIVRGVLPGQDAIFGQLRGAVELSQLGELQQTPTGSGTEEEPVFVAPTQAATVLILIVVNEGDLKPGRGAGVGEEGILELDAHAWFAFVAEPLGLPDVKVPAFVAAQPALMPIQFELTWLQFEAVRRLCIQPVRIGSISIEKGWPFPVFSINYTGKGLAFGQPGANQQWRKGDVIFEWRNWMTVWNAAYNTLDIALNEDDLLRAEVNEDDCIEVFFVDTFDVPSTWGGGATFSSGLASSKVISSDDNAEPVCVGGTVACNITHLAHELGHVMTLHHPGVGGIPAHMVNGNTGTLLCPSGFVADNPRRNSVENENNVNNPLFQYLFLAPLGPAPDCTNDADCGICQTVTDP